MTQTFTTRHSVSGSPAPRQPSRLLSGVLAGPLLAAALGALPAHAELPSVATVIHYTGSQEGGGNGGFPPNGNSTIYYPTKAFVEDANGYLYSSTAGGGGYAYAANYAGVAGQGELFYRYSPAGGQEVLDRGIDTGNLRPKLMTVASNGRLYSIEGATASQGALRRYTPGTGWEVLAVTPYNVNTPWIEGADGRLFNTRASNRDLYAVDKDGASGVQVIHTFDSTVTSRAIIMLSHSNGRLYGYGAILRNTGSGNAWRPLVFSILPDGSDVQVHKESIGDAGTYGGGSSITDLVEAADGRLYGTTLLGGTNNTGVLFRLDADGSNYEVLHEFGATDANTDGIRPTSLAVGADGHIYGTTLIGGVNSNGVIFRWNTTGSTYEALYAFNALTAHTALGSNTGYNPDGKQPLGLMRASDGTLYGMAQLGGNHGWGTVFTFNPGDEVPVFKFEPQIKFSATALNNVGGGQPVGASRIALGREVTFTWSSQLAANCVAGTDEPGNPWNGSRAASSAGDKHTPAQLGIWTYTLTCDSTSTDFPDPVKATYTIEVVSPDPEPESGGNGGGGAFVAGLALLPLAAAGFWRRRKRVA